MSHGYKEQIKDVGVYLILLFINWCQKQHINTGIKITERNDAASLSSSPWSFKSFLRSFLLCSGSLTTPRSYSQLSAPVPALSSHLSDPSSQFPALSYQSKLSALNLQLPALSSQLLVQALSSQPSAPSSQLLALSPKISAPSSKLPWRGRGRGKPPASPSEEVGRSNSCEGMIRLVIVLPLYSLGRQW